MTLRRRTKSEETEVRIDLELRIDVEGNNPAGGSADEVEKRSGRIVSMKETTRVTSVEVKMIEQEEDGRNGVASNG